MVPGNGAASEVVSRSVKTRGSLPEGSALLLSLVEALQERLDSDAALQAACASLGRIGLTARIKVELVAGTEGPRVVAADARAGVPQWNEKDMEVLRSVGIASEPGTDGDARPPQPRRREPR
jgi:hypothetical protein